MTSNSSIHSSSTNNTQGLSESCNAPCNSGLTKPLVAGDTGRPGAFSGGCQTGKNMARKAVRTLMAVALLTALLTPVLSSSASATMGETAGATRVMIVGDSISSGLGDSSGDLTHEESLPTYRSNLATKLGTSATTFDFVGGRVGTTDLNVVLPDGRFGEMAINTPETFDEDHQSHDGFSTTKILNLANVGSSGTFASWTATANPDLVVIHAGTVDVIDFTTTQTIVDNLGTMIDQVRAVNPNAHFIIANLGGVGLVGRTAGLNAFNNLLSDPTVGIVATHNQANSRVVIADTNTGFDNATMNYDDVNPNSVGQEHIATAIFGAMVSSGIINNVAPTSAFSKTCTFLDCTFTSLASDSDGSIASTSWSFGDTGTSTSVSPPHTYVAGGEYTVTQTVTDNDGMTAATSQTFTVAANQAPTAAFPVPACTLLDCTANGSSSTDTDGTIASYSWDWGDSTALDSGSTPGHSYVTAGTYTVTLTVTDDQGLAGTPATRDVTVSTNPPPVASFPAPSCNELTCSVDGSGSTDSNGTIASYSWDWGDGSVTPTALPNETASHTYNSDGTYIIALTVTDNHGGTNTATQSVTVAATPPPTCNGGYYLGEQDGQVYPFGDGITDPAPAPPAGATLIDIQSTPTGCGFWLLYSNGSITPIGDATNLGNFPATSLGAGESLATFSSTPTGAGLWGFTNLGRVIVLGDATHLSDLPTLGIVPSQDIVDSVALPSGTGYFMLGADGGIFAFPISNPTLFQGSLPGLGVILNSPAVGIVPDPDGTGYWIIASDGGAFGFAAPFRGSLPGLGITPNNPIIGMVAFGNGYLQVATDGGVFNFSDQVFSGSLPQLGIIPNTPIIAITPLP